MNDPGRNRRLRHRFSRAAATYEAHALVQRQAAEELAGLLPADLPPAGWLVEIGCGPGLFTAELCRRYPDRSLLAIDFSHAMAVRAAGRSECRDRLQVVCADGERLPLVPAAPVGLVASNAAWQWFRQPLAAADVVADMLQPGGVFVAAVFGPGSLAELGRALREGAGLDVRLPAADFLPFERYQQYFSSRFAQVEAYRRTYRRRYDSCRRMLAHLRRTGTSGPGRRSVLRPGHLPLLDRWFRDHLGGCYLTFEVFFLRGRR